MANWLAAGQEWRRLVVFPHPMQGLLVVTALATGLKKACAACQIL